MADEQNPERARRLIVERLVGATGEDDHVTATARITALRALPQIMEPLKELLACDVDIEIKTVEIIRIADAKPADDSHEAVSIVASDTSRDAITMQIDPAAISIFVNAFLGGDEGMPLAPMERSLSPIELDVVQQVFEIIAKAMNGKGPRAFRMHFPVMTPVFGDDLRRLVVRDGPGVRVVFSVSTPAGSGEIRGLMPQRVLLENRGVDDADEQTVKARHAEWRARFGGEVMRSDVPLTAMIPMNRMTLGEIAGLEVGQLIALPATARSEVKLCARDKEVFVCEFGKLGQQYTVRVRHPYDAGREVMKGLMSR